jgi:hypothetical protein
MSVSTLVPRGEARTWCPACRRPQPHIRQEGTTDWQPAPVYVCRAYGHVGHEPVLRMALSDQPAPAPDA